ncbi:MAG: GNAT family N-acetyltransferase [Gammaproteobacteria bacterium]
MFRLTSQRLMLRKLGREDLEELVALDSDPEVMRYLSDGAPSSREHVENMLERMLAWEPEDPVGFYAGLLGDAWVGWFHLRPSIAADGGALEIGFRLHRVFWGRQLATEGARALATFAVDELGARWIDGCTRPDNAASIAVLRKCGLCYVDVRRHPRAPIDVAFYRSAPAAIVRGSWRRPGAEA